MSLLPHVAVWKYIHKLCQSTLHQFRVHQKHILSIARSIIVYRLYVFELN
jgi:hypothetical protein